MKLSVRKVTVGVFRIWKKKQRTFTQQYLYLILTYNKQNFSPKNNAKLLSLNIYQSATGEPWRCELKFYLYQ